MRPSKAHQTRVTAETRGLNEPQQICQSGFSPDNIHHHRLGFDLWNISDFALQLRRRASGEIVMPEIPVFPKEQSNAIANLSEQLRMVNPALKFRLHRKKVCGEGGRPC